MKLFLAVVRHEFGATFFNDFNHEGLQKKVADWCREYWRDDWNDEASKNASDEITITTYFLENRNGYKESVTFGDDELILP